MVLVFNLEEEASSDAVEPNDAHSHTPRKPSQSLDDATIAVWNRKPVLPYRTSSSSSTRQVENVGLFSAALACYPVVAQLAQNLDLNSLDNLSRTCHLVQALLRIHRKSLIALTLRCTNDERRKDAARASLGSAPSSTDALSLSSPGIHRQQYPTQFSKRIPCATDLVGHCRRCSTLVCRNCTAKALPTAKVARRHRRLCNVCVRAPLATLMAPHLNSTRPSFTYPAFTTGVCECAMFFWICQPCGQGLVIHDTDYHRIWTWRIRYSTYLGGLGTGIGEGHEGVKCGRGEECLAARKIEVEEDCSTESTSTIGTPRGDSRPASQHSFPTSTTAAVPATSANIATTDAEFDPEKAGYFRQEVEGIGGLLRGKVKKMVVVGKTVQEHEDERENGDYLSREAKGINRSWCSWCERIIPSLKDQEKLSQG